MYELIVKNLNNAPDLIWSKIKGETPSVGDFLFIVVPGVADFEIKVTHVFRDISNTNPVDVYERRITVKGQRL